MWVFRAANGHLISTIESKSTNPSGDAPKNVGRSGVPPGGLKFSGLVAGTER
jgi:hypothetical protein